MVLQYRPGDSAVMEALLQAFGHPHRIFFSLVITGNCFCFPIAVTAIKMPCMFVGFAYFELAAFKASSNRALFQPVEYSLADTGRTPGGVHTQQVQVCLAVSVVHDPEANYIAVVFCRDHVNVG